MQRILVIGAGGPAGVNFINSLHLSKREFYIIGTDINPYHIQFIKPIVNKTYLIHKYDHPQYKSDIVKIIQHEGVDSVYIQTDIEVGYWGQKKHRKIFDDLNVKYILPSEETIIICQDKGNSAENWAKNRPFYFSDKSTIDEVFLAFQFHKHVRLWIRSIEGAGGKASIMAETPEKAYHWIRFWQNYEPGIKLIAQEYIEGKNIAWTSLWYNGKLIVSQARERLEYIYPHLNPSGITGTPAVAKTINNDLVNKECVFAIRKIDPKPHGVYSVDMIQRDNQIYITEINPGRFFTTSYYFSRAGYELNIPYANMPDLLTYLTDDNIELFKEKYELTKIPCINILPEDYYWIRHIDIPAQLIEHNKIFNF